MSLRHATHSLLALLLAGAFAPEASAQRLFRADLTGAQEVPPVTTTAGGLATAVLDGSTLIFRGQFSGLESDYNVSVGSHIHNGAVGANGPIVLTLDPALDRDLRGGQWYGPENRFPLDADQIEALRSGQYYVNVHSLDNSGGEIRGQLTQAVTLNEIRSDQPGTDVDEYVELSGPAGTSLDGFSLVILGDGSDGDIGVIEEVIDLSGQTIPDDGYFLFGQLTSATPDFDVDLNLENGAGATFLLVEGVAGNEGDDLDTNDDGTLDANPWSTISDAVGFASGASGDATYAAQLGFEDVGPDGDFRPGHLFRNRDDGNWRIGAFDPEGGFDTPGAINASAALVQLVHNSPDPGTPTVDVYLNDELLVDDLAFQSATPYTLLRAGESIKIDIAPGASTASGESFAGQDITLDGSRSYYAVVVGIGGTGGTTDDDPMIVFYDNARRFSTTPGTVDIGFLHGALDTGTIDVRTGVTQQAILFNAVPYGTYAQETYQPTTPAVLDIDITSAAPNIVLAQFEPDFAGLAGQSALLIASGSATPEATAPIALLVVQPDGTTTVSAPINVAREETPDGALVLNVANPLGADTQVSYALPASGEASLVLYDALGREVAVLASGEMGAGPRSATLRASALAPGVYVLRLAAERRAAHPHADGGSVSAKPLATAGPEGRLGFGRGALAASGARGHRRAFRDSSTRHGAPEALPSVSGTPRQPPTEGWQSLAECTGLENRRTARYRGFESLPLRNADVHPCVRRRFS